MRTLSTTFNIALAILVSVSLSACDSGTDDGNNDAPDFELSAATKSAVGGTVADVFFTLVPEGLAQGPSSKSYQVNKRFANCPGGGTAAVTGSKSNVSGFDFYEIEIDLSGCNDLNGILHISGDGRRNAEEDRLTVGVRTNIERGQCTINMTSGAGSTAAGDGVALYSSKNLLNNTWTQTLNGRVTGTCSGEKYSCSFSDSSLDPNSAGSSVIAEQGGCRRTEPVS